MVKHISVFSTLVNKKTFLCDHNKTKSLYVDWTNNQGFMK